MSIDSLKPFLQPRSIAIIGASDNTNKIGGRPLHFLQRFAFKGGIYPINPARREVQGIACHSSVAALPEVPDLAVIAVPGDSAIAAVEDCAALGVKAAIVITSGFGETSDPVGLAKQHRMVASARAGRMRMVGPNTQGLANFANGAVASFSTMFTEIRPKDGPIAIVSQSGAMAAVPLGLLNANGLGVRYSLATGNDADVSILEMATAAVSDPDIRLLLLYLEGIPRPDLLAELADLAHRNGVYIVALKSGRTPAGQRAAQSHTGALANEDRVVEAALKRVGIWRAKDTAGLVSAAEMYLKGWKPKGRRLVTISGSGATGVLSADAATFGGLELVQFSKETRANLDAILPTFASAANPIDLTAALLSNNGLLSEILPVIARDGTADAVKIDIPVGGPGYDVPRFARDIAAFSRETGNPVVVAGWQPQVAAAFRAEGVPIFPLETEAIEAIAQLANHCALVEQTRQRPLPQWKAYEPAAENAAMRTLNEADSLAVLGTAGLNVVKGCSADLPHKSDHGLVALGLDDETSVAAAFTDMRGIIERLGATCDGVIVARMTRGRREAVIGAHRDAFFGPVVMVGDGGKYVEAMPDVGLLIPPFARKDAEDAIQDLRCAPVLNGVRGEGPMDIAAMAEAAVRVGNLMLRNPQIVSIDMNPIILADDGQGAMIVDAVVVMSA
jgi:acyl-CoA synthetase (NDP forming)